MKRTKLIQLVKEIIAEKNQLNEEKTSDFNEWLRQVSYYKTPKQDLIDLGVDINTITPEEFIEAVVENGETGEERGLISDAVFGKSIHVTYKEGNVRVPHINFSYGLEYFGSWRLRNNEGSVLDRNEDPRDRIYPPGSRMD